MFLPKKVLEERIRHFLEEDLGQGDLTTSLLIPNGTIVEAEIIAKEEGIIAGIQEAMIFLESHNFQVKAPLPDGTRVKEKAIVLKIIGDARTILSTERTLLNILTRMSGVATKTHRLIEKIRSAGFQTRVACTRKVAPGFSYFDKKAVMLGGGDTHRLHLDDLVLIKDNHLAIVGGISKAIRTARKTVSFAKKIEIEVSGVEEALEAAKSGADIVLLDNFSPRKVMEAISMIRKNRLRDKVLIEASGGIDEKNILKYAATTVDIVSLGEITDSAKALDVSLDIKKIVR